MTKEEFRKVVISDINSRDEFKQPLLRTPEILPHWLETLEAIMADTGDLLGALAIEIKYCPDRFTLAELTQRQSKDIAFRTRVRIRLYEARRLAGVKSNDNSESKLRQVEGQLKKLQHEHDTLKENYKTYKGMRKKFDTQVEHSQRLEAERAKTRAALYELQTLIKNGISDKNAFLEIISKALGK